MVNINCTGGGGYFSDDVSATKAQVIQGYTTLTSDSDDEIVEGTMIECNKADQYVSLNTSNHYLYINMRNGAHRLSEADRNPEIYVPLDKLRIEIGATDASKILNDNETVIAGLRGTMINRGAWNGTLGLSGQVTIPKGYHNGKGKVTRQYSTFAGGTFTPQATDQTIATANKIVTGNIVCAGSDKLIASNIKHGVQIFGVTGQCPSSQYDAYNGTTFKGALSNGLISGVNYYYERYEGASIGNQAASRMIYHKFDAMPGTTPLTGYNISDVSIRNGQTAPIALYVKNDFGDTSKTFYGGYRSNDIVKIGYYKNIHIEVTVTDRWMVDIHSCYLCLTNQAGNATQTLTASPVQISGRTETVQAVWGFDFNVANISADRYLGIILRYTVDGSNNVQNKYLYGTISKITIE